jgi:glutamate N-acetyltransferase / amino-acid N-acetyltransferase
VVTVGTTVLFDRGRPHDERASEAAEYLKGKDLTVSVDLGAGRAASTVWTCDLSAEYVRINADYRT